MKLVVLLGFVLAAACADTIWETAVKTEQLSSLVKALNGTTPESKKLIDALNQTNSSLTLFAPSNDAFAKNHSNLTETVVKYHLLGAIINSTDLKEGIQFVATATDQGYILEVNRNEEGVELMFDLDKTSKVTTANVVCDGGIVHIVDTILEIPKTTSQVAKEAGLNQLISETARLGIDLDSQLRNVTVFAPDDVAFNTSSFDDMLPEAAVDTISYHVLAGHYYSTDLKDGQELTTLLGDKLLVQIKDGEVTVGGAKVTFVNALTQSNVVHVVDKVIRVPFSPTRSFLRNIALQPDTTKFLEVLQDPRAKPVLDLLDGAANATVFVPSNAALAGVNLSSLSPPALQAALTYHVLPAPVRAGALAPLQFPATLLSDPELGPNRSQVLQVTAGEDGVHVNNASVTRADLVSSSDVVTHVIDQLLSVPEATAVVANKSGLNILLEQVVRTGINVSLPDITILAPTDDAFNNFNANLSKINGSDVKAVLLNHIIQGSLFSLDLANMTSFTTLGNTTYNITKKDGKIMLDGANVLIANVLTENGVVHVIDRVLGGPGPGPGPKPDDGKGVAPGAVVGIVVGVLAGVAIVGYCCFKSSNDDGYKPM